MISLLAMMLSSLPVEPGYVASEIPPMISCESDDACNNYYFSKCGTDHICVPEGTEELSGCEIIDHFANKHSSGLFPKLIGLIARRESKCKWWIKHEMKADKKASIIAHKRMEDKDYYKDNQYFHQSYRWETIGPLGQNTNLFLYEYDANAKPEAIYNPEIAILAYISKAETAYKKLTSKKLSCDGKPFHGTSCKNGKCRPSYYDIHLIVSGGRFCPRPRGNKKREWMERNAGSWMYRPVYESHFRK